jgi:hypothetical protein
VLLVVSQWGGHVHLLVVVRDKGDLEMQLLKGSQTQVVPEPTMLFVTQANALEVVLLGAFAHSCVASFERNA